jgi:hypothetical protein
MMDKNINEPLWGRKKCVHGIYDNLAGKTGGRGV